MNLAIRGHYTRGKEVIKILEMLGGRNVDNLDGNAIYYYYTIMDDKKIIGAAFYLKALDDKFYILSLEEFLEKFPYKVGDKVYNIIHNENQTITDLAWDSQEYEIVYQTNNNEYLFVNYLQPYKEETMKEKEEIMESKFIVVDYVKESDNRYRIVLNHEFDMEVDEGEYYAVRRKPQYPKTYKECCELLSLGEGLFTKGYKASLIQDFQKLLICRDAYWNIAGKQMGLGKPWQPDCENITYFIYYNKCDNAIRETSGNLYFNKNFAFPTEEMRDAFFENFKDLIEQCKELL